MGHFLFVYIKGSQRGRYRPPVGDGEFKGGGSRSKWIWGRWGWPPPPDKNQYLSKITKKYSQNISQYHNFFWIS